MEFNDMKPLMAGTCAVCCLLVSPQEYVENRSETSIRIIGTAFLVRETTAITNRHVLLELRRFQAEKRVPDDRLYLWFVYSTATGRQEGYCKIKQHGVILDKNLDIAFVEFVRRPEPEFNECQPLSIIAQCAPNIGEEIAVCGYPYGVDALRDDPEEAFYRVGPVLQFGRVSAIAPWNFTHSNAITEIILDVRTAGGMSGAPVVRQSDGAVIGVHYAGIEATMAFAIPLDRQRLDKWLVAHGTAHNLKIEETGKNCAA